MELRRWAIIHLVLHSIFVTCPSLPCLFYQSTILLFILLLSIIFFLKPKIQQNEVIFIKTRKLVHPMKSHLFSHYDISVIILFSYSSNGYSYWRRCIYVFSIIICRNYFLLEQVLILLKIVHMVWIGWEDIIFNRSCWRKETCREFFYYSNFYDFNGILCIILLIIERWKW